MPYSVAQCLQTQRELYQELMWSWPLLAAVRETVQIKQSHGARATGLFGDRWAEADVVTLPGHDIDAIASQAELVASDWQSRLPHNSRLINDDCLAASRQ